VSQTEGVHEKDEMKFSQPIR